MNKYLLLGIGILALVLAGCQTHYDNTNFSINYQDTLKLSNDLSIKFSNVTEDSRCPQGAQCIWEGKISIVFDIIEKGEKTGEFTLSSNPDDSMKTQGINNYSISLVSVNPYPEIDKPFAKEDYIATISVSE